MKAEVVTEHVLDEDSLQRTNGAPWAGRWQTEYINRSLLMITTRTGSFFCFAILLLSMLLTGCKSRRQNTWQLVFQNDINGETLYGDKALLIDAIKKGNRVRISWGETLEDGASCIEFAEPHFISLINGADVVVQVPSSIIQTSYTSAPDAFLNTDHPTAWHALMSTDGHYHQFHAGLDSGNIKRILFLRANISWYVDGDFGLNVDREPVLDALNGIVLDNIVHKQ